MSAARLLEVFRRTLTHNLRRPLFWILVVLVALTAWGLSQGNVQIGTGSSDTGGKKAWMTSQFTLSMYLSILVFLYYGFFVAVGAGMIVIQDEEDKVGELLHATPLSTREYVWGKWLAVLVTFMAILALELAFHAVSNHLLTGAEDAERVGPFVAWNYLKPALVLGQPQIVLVAGVTFLLGTWTRRAIPVFFFPAALLLVCVFFLWSWNPSWLQADWPALDRWLSWIDPAGLRWLNHTWLDVDRGADFYNTGQVTLDAPFAASRVALVLIGLAAVHIAERRFHRTLRGARAVRTSTAAATEPLRAARELPPLSTLSMYTQPLGLLRGTTAVAQVELAELKSQAGLYLFVPLILLQTLGAALVRVGPFDTPMLSTSGTLAADAFNTLTLLVCLLLAFYTVESLERERARGLAPIHYATPLRTLSLLLGKAIANSLVGAVILLAAFVACVVVLLIQGRAPIRIGPFAVLWGLLLLPTFFAWSAFVSAAYALVRNRYTSYAVALAVLAFSGYRQMKGHTTWTSNWNLWSAVRWSDLGPLELDREALVLNRLLWISAGVALSAFAVRLFPRRSLDPSSVLLRLRPWPLLVSTLRFSPFLVVPVTLMACLMDQVDEGRQGAAMEKKGKDYWRRNLATWKDAPNPSINDVVLDVTIEPPEHRYEAEGSYALLNDHDRVLHQFAVTPGAHMRELSWTLDGSPAEPEDRSGLLVFSPTPPLEPGASVRLGFRFEGRLPDGISKNGAGMGEFILSSGAVLTSFGPSFVPSIGFLEGVGIDEDNRYDAREYAEDFYQGVTRSAFGNNASCTTRVTVHIPEEYSANSVGELVSETVEGGVRTAVWQSDYPVEFFNVICGQWSVRRGEGTVLYYHPGHEWNVAEIGEALDASRRFYSQWFMPFPWKELKLSEFAAHATYAQGFPTNITFSEGVGFLAKSDPRSRVAFLVTAHEAAHQWWGNLLVPGEGPGGNVLSEGMAHFSTMLLIEAVRGLRERIEFARRIESSYGKSRQIDSERPLYKVDGSRDGDTTVTYDKGGWVFWMLLNHMGRERTLAGLQAFLSKYHHNPDHPVLQDFVALMRDFAPDAQAYDAFTRQWFAEVVVPEYALSDARSEELDGSWRVSVTLTNKGTGRMPIEVCAARGKRFPDEEEDGQEQAGEKGEEAYREARETLMLGPGESQTVELVADFEPERVLCDPDCLVLQLRREKATVDL